jgi:phage baseplate assembly protein V
MSQVLQGAVERLYRRILLAVGRGRITLVDDSGPVQKVQIRLSPLELRDKTPRLAEFGFTSNPPAGSDAVPVFVAGDRSNAVIIATGNQTYRLRGLASGEVALYDSRGQSVELRQDGIRVITPLKVTVTAGGDMKLSAPNIELDASSSIKLKAPTITEGP